MQVTGKLPVNKQINLFMEVFVMANQTLYGAPIYGKKGAVHESVKRTKMKNRQFE